MEKGRLIAKVLAGSWRPSPAPLDLSEAHLEIVAPLLLTTGAGALAWRRVANSDLQGAPTALELKQAYRLHALQSAINESNLVQALNDLQSGGIEPILVKGWAVARLYPDDGVRPYGDLDLCVAPGQYAAARQILEGTSNKSYQVDLHRGFKTLDHLSWDELWSRSELVKLNDQDVRVLCPEDHLRVLCFHFLREGAWRPLWLCDIAVAIETRSDNFDWDVFSDGRQRRRGKWLASALALAEQLLGANLYRVPDAMRNPRLPSWFLPAVLKEWEVRSMSQRHASPMGSALSPKQTMSFKSLRAHWPNPIEASVGVNGPLNEVPRLPFQLANCAMRTVAFLSHSITGSA
jgi:hypothetical protein